ncbi:transmembrane protease serine 11D-like [Hyperolius riggenbachi]|uniref:transmembrane protease serine 11D-like n=1 Tax=Hyperolius riggenbachi TaxID=752182 RepID=UPI0035A2861B
MAGKLSKHRHIIIPVAVTILLLMIIAAVVAAVVIVVVQGTRSQPANKKYYSGTFRILNLNYTSNYSRSSSLGFQALAAQIQQFIDAAFNNSELRNLFQDSKVFSLSPGSVIPAFVVTFISDPSENKNASVQQIFLESMKNTSSAAQFNIDESSLQLTEIPFNVAQNLLYSAPSSVSTGTPTLLNATTQIPLETFADCGVGGPSASSKIVGGTNAALGAWPWQASLRFNGNHKCGASLVSNTWLITAAHCFAQSKDVNSWTVVLGTIAFGSGPGLKLKNIIIHENYISGIFQNDITLLELSAPVSFTQYIRPVCLPDNMTVTPDNSSCYVTGWGTLTDGGNLASILQQAELRIINTTICASPTMYGTSIRPSMLCAGYAAGKIDSCQGDSGGPLVATQSNHRWTLIGIVSFGYGCALQNRPGVYSNVTYLRSWITQKSGI